jgi:hypothetical protein
MVMINGRTFGPKDGLTIETGEIALSGGAAPARTAAQLGTSDALFGASTTSWGSSYASTSESAQLRYTGKAYAAANIYSSKRIIDVCFQYKRAGKDLTGWVCSSADSSSGKWVPGKVASKSIWDTLNPTAPKTTFYYRKTMINPNVV